MRIQIQRDISRDVWQVGMRGAREQENTPIKNLDGKRDLKEE